MVIEPETEVMQSHLRRQASLEPSQGMWSVVFQTQDRIQLVKDRLDNLALPSQPAAQRFRPGMVTRPSGTANHLNTIVVLPGRVPGAPFKAGIDDIHPTNRLAGTGQARIRTLSRSEERLRQRLILGTAWCKTKAGDHPGGRGCHEQMEALVPTEPVAPANIRLPSQPAIPSPFRITSRDGCTIQSLIGIIGVEQSFGQVQPKGDDGIAVAPLQAVELRAGRQARKRWAQMMLGIAVEGSLARKAGPLSKERQSHHLTPAQASRRATTGRLSRQVHLVKAINHHVECGQEGIRIHQRLAPSRVEWVQANPTVRLPFFQV